MKKITPLLLVILAILFAFYMQPNSMQEVQIHTKKTSYNLLVEVSKSPKDLAQGLMERSSLTEQEGMLFVYDEDTNPSFWMKNMLIPLDILFIGNDGIIKHIEKEVPPCKVQDDQCIRYTALEPIRQVLELQSGFTSKYGVEIGDRVNLKS